MPAPPNERGRVRIGPEAMGAPAHGSRALCVVIHDVAPATWPDCLRLLHAVREVADIPLTWLVVPRWHGSEARSPAFEAALDSLLAGGHELALHGYTHLDTAARARDWRSRFLRGVYTEGEGEFAALHADEARRRINLGLAWLEERGWPVHGFVAPAWLLGEGAWEAVRGYPFLYTTTWSHFHCLMPEERQSQPREPCQQQPGQPYRLLSAEPLRPSFPHRREPKSVAPPTQHSGALLSPSLVYAARNRSGRIISPRAASVLAWLMRDSSLVRLALHPRDAHHPALLRHAQSLIAHLLQSRTALTKASFARQWTGATSTAPSIRPATSASGPARHSSADIHSAADRPAR